MLDNTRLNLLFAKFAVSQEMPDEELNGLTLEELSFIYAATESAKKDEKFAAIHFPIRQQIIYWAAVEAFKNAEALYVLNSKAPIYPYIDPNGGAWVFSAEDLAVKVADDLKEKQQVELVVRKLENKMVKPMLAQFYYLGIDRIVVDNGSHPIILKRTDILPEPDWAKDAAAGQDFCNGPLQMSMIQFFQYIQHVNTVRKAASAETASEEQKKELNEKLAKEQQVVRILESRMLANLVDAKFLIPTVTIKDGTPLPPGQTASGEGVTRKIANLVDGNKVVWLPAFTDWPEFAKAYKPTEWGAAIMDYEGLKKVAKDTKIEKIVFNPRGCAFRVDDKIMGNIDAFRQKKAEFEAKRAAEQGEEAPEKPAAKQPEPVKPESKPAAESAVSAPAAEASGKAVYAELSVEPEMMMAALKRSAKALKTVKRMWLAERIQGDTSGYLLVVEASDFALAKDELRRAGAGYLDGKVMEIKEANAEGLANVSDIRPFYKKGLFG